MRIAPLERAGQFAVSAFDGRARIHVARRAEAPRDIVERHLLGAEHAIAVGEGHRAYFGFFASRTGGYGTGLYGIALFGLDAGRRVVAQVKRAPLAAAGCGQRQGRRERASA